MKINVNEITIAYDIFGKPVAQPLFLIHGFGDCRLHMRSLALRLSAERRVICYDCRGHGQSTKPEKYSLEDHGRDLVALLDAFGYERADVVGFSMGSYVAGQSAILSPHRVRRLVLICPKAYDSGCGSSITEYFVRRGFEQGIVTNNEQKKRLISEAVWSPATSPELRAAVSATFRDIRTDPEYSPMSADDHARAVDSLKGFDLRSGYAILGSKTLVISAQHDGFNPYPLGWEISSIIPDCRFKLILNAAHNVIYEAEEELSDCIRDFLRE